MFLGQRGLFPFFLSSTLILLLILLYSYRFLESRNDEADSDRIILLVALPLS